MVCRVMKRYRYIVAILAMFLVLVTASGKPVTEAEVREVVHSLLADWDKDVEIVNISPRYLPGREGGYYMVDLGNAGWVMVSGDDVVQPVLAYSFENRISPESTWKRAAVRCRITCCGTLPSAALPAGDHQRNQEPGTEKGRTLGQANTPFHDKGRIGPTRYSIY